MPRTRSTLQTKPLKGEDPSSNLSEPPEIPSPPPSTSFKDSLARFGYKNGPTKENDTPPSTSLRPRTKRPRTKTPPPPKASQQSTSNKKPRTTTTLTSPSTSAPLNPLPDILAPNLICIFIGTNPGLRTAAAGHAYAHPSNLFWKLLHASGLTDRRLLPSEDTSLPGKYCMGNTNIVSRASRDAAELSRAEMSEGARVLEGKITRWRPEAVCIVGKGIWEAIWRFKYGRPIRKEEFAYGWQEGHNMGLVEGEKGWQGSRVFVATSTSGLAAGLSMAQKEAVWKPFGEWVCRRRRERGFVCGEEEGSDGNGEEGEEP